MSQLILREEGELALYEAEKALAFAEGLATMVGETQMEIAADELAAFLGLVRTRVALARNGAAPG
jgi:hypothetical protein